MTRAVPFLLLAVVGAGRAEDPPKVAPAKHPDLRSELLRRVKIDQGARLALIEFTKQHGPDPASKKAEYEKLRHAVELADRENTARLAEVIAKSGWPTVTQVGADGAHAAWLLVQHADANAKFQRQCLDLMTKVPKAEVSQTDVAYLTDRVLLAEGKKQMYGTQFTSVGGKWEPRPLEDPTKVDERRKAVGLPPLADYVKQLEEMYGKAEKK
jgi:hypothetical protein